MKTYVAQAQIHCPLNHEALQKAIATQLELTLILIVDHEGVAVAEM